MGTQLAKRRIRLREGPHRRLDLRPRHEVVGGYGDEQRGRRVVGGLLRQADPAWAAQDLCQAAQALGNRLQLRPALLPLLPCCGVLLTSRHARPS
jgi:hypothetical protein